MKFSVGFSVSSGLEGHSQSDPIEIQCSRISTFFTAGQPVPRLSPRSEEILRSYSWLHQVILYFTLVADKVVPDVFLFDFLHLSQWISSAAHRRASRLAHVTDVEAVLFVHGEQVKMKDQAREEKAAVDTFVAAASFPPTRYKSRLHFARFQGPSARKDAEESERQRWLQLLANLIVGTDTPWGGCSSRGQGTYPCWVLAGELGHYGAESGTFGIFWRGLPSIMASHTPRNRRT